MVEHWWLEIKTQNIFPRQVELQNVTLAVPPTSLERRTATSSELAEHFDSLSLALRPSRGRGHVREHGTRSLPALGHLHCAR